LAEGSADFRRTVFFFVDNGVSTLKSLELCIEPVVNQVSTPLAEGAANFLADCLWFVVTWYHTQACSRNGLIFENDVKNSRLHYKDAAIAATENHKKQRNGSDEDSKPVEPLDSDNENELIHKKQRKI
jgi:hypothetical protein